MGQSTTPFPSATAKPPSTSEIAWLESMTRARKILLVEDDDMVRGVFRAILRRYNCVVTEARDGDEGIRLFRNDPPDVMFLDLRLPLASGYEVFQVVRKWNKLLPVVVIAGEINEAVIDRLYTHGYCHFVRKPFDVNKDFIDAILSPLFLQRLPDSAIL
jgi:CheY-like chemotaxis protein